MSGNETRRGLWQAIAATQLPLPVDVTIYERDDPDEPDGVHRWAGLRLDDNSPELVDAWAQEHKPAYGPATGPGNGYRAFRPYEVDVILAGWKVKVCSYVDTEVVKP